MPSDISRAEINILKKLHSLDHPKVALFTKYLAELYLAANCIVEAEEIEGQQKALEARTAITLMAGFPAKP